MKNKFIVLPLALACASQFASAATSDAERIAKIEQELAVLKEAANTESLADRMSVNGFFTGKIGVADNKAGYNGYDNDVDFAEGSKLGLQGTFALTDQTKIVAQLVARGKDDWETEMEWAFLSHDFDNGFTGRVGRLRVPLYMYSDYLEVGYAQPWATPPSELYSIVPLTSFDGGDLIYETDLGEASLTLQASYGHASRDAGTAIGDVDYKNVAGASAQVGYEDWTFRTTYYQTTLDSKKAGAILEFDKDKGYFAGIGLGYDNGELLVVSEFAVSDVNGTYADTESGYLTVGYRVGAFTPYVSYAFLKTTDDNERKVISPLTAQQKAAFDWKRDAYSIGTRYDIASNLALKLDVTYTGNFDDTSGGMSSNLSTTGPVEDDSIVYTVSFDAVF